MRASRIAGELPAQALHDGGDLGVRGGALIPGGQGHDQGGGIGGEGIGHEIKAAPAEDGLDTRDGGGKVFGPVEKGVGAFQGGAGGQVKGGKDDPLIFLGDQATGQGPQKATGAQIDGHQEDQGQDQAAHEKFDAH